MYQKLSKKQLIEKILLLEQEKTSLIKLYLASDNLIKESTAHISDLWMIRLELEEENKNLKNHIKIPFDIKNLFDEIKKGENSNHGKEF